MHKSQTLRKGIFLFLFAVPAVFLSSCQEKISGIGSAYLRDTISSGIHTYSDSSALNFQPLAKRTAIISYGRTAALNTAASALLIGKVSGENLESWAAMKIPIVPDSIGVVLTDTLMLRMRFAYQYGDAADRNIDFSVYTETNNKVNDSTATLSMADLGQILGTFHGTVAGDSLLTANIPLDVSVMNQYLRTASLALVIVPNSGMNTIRAFASNENGDNTFSPQLKFSIKGTTDTTKKIWYPSNDFHLVISDKAAPSGEFLLRGSYASREKIVINIKNIRNGLQLNPFVTINSALVQVRSDHGLHTQSNVPVDTIGPALASIPNTSVGDSGHSFLEYGSHSTVDPDLYTYQIRSLIEHALRLGDDSVVLELRAGFAYRTVKGSSVDVEDYNIDRWVVYGMDYSADLTKRPKLVITYSYLR